MRKKYYLFILIFIVSLHVYNNYFLQFMLVGTYINVNFVESPAFPRAPDTLRLYENNKFYSPKLGYGTYSLKYKFGETTIDFIGKESMERKINRTWRGKPKIVMFRDLNHHYEKISSKTE